MYSKVGGSGLVSPSLLLKQKVVTKSMEIVSKYLIFIKKQYDLNVS